MKEVMWRKLGITLIIGIILLLGLIPHRAVSAAGQDIVILSTDNEADMAMAYGVASILNAKVVISPWGTYDPAVSAEILSAEPVRVIVIGGPVAIPEDYTRDLEDFGIPYERWYGETRYETNLEVIERLRTEFPEVFGEVHSVVIANGRDGLALREYSESTKMGPVGVYRGTLIVLTDSGRINETLDAVGKFEKLDEVIYLGTFDGNRPLFPLNKEWLSDFIRGRFGTRVNIKERATSPGIRDTGQVLLAVQNKTKRAEKLLDGLQIPAARMKLENAKNLLKRAWEEYNAGNYSKAYRLAMMASWNADFVIARAYREVMTIYQGSARMRLERRLAQFEIMVSVLERKGYDVSDVKVLLEEAREALRRGDYSIVLHDLIPQIKAKLAERALRDHGVMTPPSSSPHKGRKDKP